MPFPLLARSCTAASSPPPSLPPSDLSWAKGVEIRIPRSCQTWERIGRCGDKQWGARDILRAVEDSVTLQNKYLKDNTGSGT